MTDRPGSDRWREPGQSIDVGVAATGSVNETHVRQVRKQDGATPSDRGTIGDRSCRRQHRSQRSMVGHDGDGSAFEPVGKARESPGQAADLQLWSNNLPLSRRDRTMKRLLEFIVPDRGGNPDLESTHAVRRTTTSGWKIGYDWRQARQEGSIRSLERGRTGLENEEQHRVVQR
ncbi:hypothetical protein A4X06_0g9534 [Tilletia controversa]|uniref:Uncharacterized protein n=1 Tax=Tilletia controversa TaxID=13291 RepID=A0A8X7MI96_9BASI|nr:hypothetical protein CF328_g9506 [Tilletia controversa]KAE8179403.1 hypothetical protein CF335_g9605 [Tilletia laevis]KAE8236488.1 hypothetical protein A4X06_0g9534 [Tilletia controversa]